MTGLLRALFWCAAVAGITAATYAAGGIGLLSFAILIVALSVK